jgi:hypothetical protein
MTGPAPTAGAPVPGQPAPSTGAPAPTQAPPTDPTAQPPAADPPGRSIESLPEWAQKEIRDARGEAGTYRTQLRDAQTAQTQQAELLNSVAKALGLKTDGKPDPERLAADLESVKGTARQTQIELAVYRAAGPAGAKPDAVLDSRSFMQSVVDLDPASKTFGDDVAKAIKAAVDSNPLLKAEQKAPAPPGPSGAPLNGGPGDGKTKPATLGEAITAAISKQ